MQEQARLGPGGEVLRRVERGKPVVCTKLCFAKTTEVGKQPRHADGVLYIGSDPSHAYAVRRAKTDKGGHEQTAVTHIR